ncbi:uncharacterized protein FFM5_11773 [Fusarium fujikuroi]|nr:uncharacterized protein FFM5_11773 [Fusarium fujikuroi]
MADDNNKNKKTQNDPKNKGKGKDDDKQLARRAGSQSGQHNSSTTKPRNDSVMRIRPRNALRFATSQDAIGQKHLALTDGLTGRFVENEMAVSTDFVGKTTIGFSANTPSGAHEAVDAIAQVQKEDEVIVGALTLTSKADFMAKNCKRKRLTLDRDEEAEFEARTAARQARRAAFLQHGDQQSSGQASGQDQGSPDDHSEERIRCVGCKSDKHTLAVCLKAGADGYMKGCPFCNTMDHSAGNCPHPALKDNKLLRLRHFVYDRRNMPSFLNVKAWYPLVRKHAQSKEAYHRYPWTPEFTKSIAGRINEIQRRVDKNGPGGAKLPVDPSVKGWPAVLAYHEGLERQEKEKALAEARSKVAPLSELQKAAAAFLNASLVPETRVDEPEKVNKDVDMADNGQVVTAPETEEPSATTTAVEDEPSPEPSPEPESEYLALAKEQHDASQLQPWDEVDSDDDDDDEEEFARQKLILREAQAEATKRGIRAKSYTTEL